MNKRDAILREKAIVAKRYEQCVCGLKGAADKSKLMKQRDAVWAEYKALCAKLNACDDEGQS